MPDAGEPNLFECPFCRNQTVLSGGIGHLSHHCQDFAQEPRWLETYSYLRPTREKLLQRRHQVLTQFEAPKRSTSVADSGDLIECAVCKGLLRDDEHYKTHLLYSEDCLQYKQKAWFEAFKTLFSSATKPSPRQLMKGQILRLYRRLTAMGKVASDVDPELQKDPDYHFIYAATLQQPDQTSSEVNRSMKRTSPDSDGAASKKPRTAQSATKETSNCGTSKAFNSTSSFIDELISSDVIFWFTWGMIAQTVQEIKSTAELILLRPFDHIAESIQEDLSNAEKLGFILSERVSYLQDNFSQDSRFQAASSRVKCIDGSWKLDTSYSDYKAVVDILVLSIEKNLRALAECVVSHAIEQRWEESNTGECIVWDGRANTLSQTINDHLESHWCYWTPLFLDLDVFLRCDAEAFQRRFEKLCHEYDARESTSSGSEGSIDESNQSS